MSDLFNDRREYGGQHRPFHESSLEEGTTAGAHEMDKVFPDYYKHPRWYHNFDIPQDPEGNRAHRQTHIALSRVRGKPEAEMNMYRAVPHGVTRINQGDWVTPSEQYARIHAMNSEDPADDWPVLHARVKAKHLLTGGDYAPEFGYNGPSMDAKIV